MDLTKTMIERGRTSHKYLVQGNIKGYTNAELIDFCDYANFGGHVSRAYDGNSAEVTVYVD